MLGRIDAQGPSPTSAITAAEKKDAFMGCEEKTPDFQRGRGLAGAADGKIAEADHWNAGTAPFGPHAQRGRHTIDAAERAKKRTTAGLPPEGWLAHLSTRSAARAEAASDRARSRSRCDQAHHRASRPLRPRRRP